MLVEMTEEEFELVKKVLKESSHEFVPDTELNDYINKVCNCLIDEYNFSEEEAIDICVSNKSLIAEEFDEGLEPGKSAHIRYIDKKYNS